MSIISIPYTFSPGGTIVSSQVNSCLSVIYNDYNGSIGNSNLSSSIVITDSKLAQISSAAKVNGSALTSLSSIPSGAGTIPVANIGVLNATNMSGIVGTAVSKTIETTLNANIYQAATDGFVSAWNSSNNTVDLFITLYSDNTSTPTTIIATQQYSSGSTPATVCVSGLIKKNNYYHVYTNNALTSQYGFYFTPIGS